MLETTRRYKHSERGKATRKKWNEKYYNSERGKEVIKACRQRRNEKRKKEREGNKNNDA